MGVFVKETAIPLVYTLHLTSSGKEEAQVLSGRTLLHIIPVVLCARNLPHLFNLFLLITLPSFGGKRVCPLRQAVISGH